MLSRFFLILSFTTSLILQISNLSASENFEEEGFNTGVTPLMNAVASKDYKAIEFFIKISPLDINKQNIGGATALHLAVRNNDQIATKILISHLSNPNLKDVEGYSSAMRSCFYNYKEVFNVLRQGSNIDFSLTNNEKDGFIILSALSKNSSCLEESLRNIIPLRDLSIMELKNRLNKAFIISLAKDDQESKEVLLKYLSKLQIFEKKIMELSRFDNKTHKRVIRKSVQNHIINTIYRLKEGYHGIKIENKSSRSSFRRSNPRIKYAIKKSARSEKSKTQYKLKGKVKNNYDNKARLNKPKVPKKSKKRSSGPKPSYGNLILDKTLVIE